MTDRELALANVIQSALDCENHFHKPNLKAGWRDADNSIDFAKSIVICEQCVKRMRDILGLQPDQHPLDAPGLER
jgi:hypothetical protein